MNLYFESQNPLNFFKFLQVKAMENTHSCHSASIYAKCHGTIRLYQWLKSPAVNLIGLSNELYRANLNH